MVVSYMVNGDTFVPDKPRLWSNVRLSYPGSGIWNYDVSPDGKRIIALIAAAPADARADSHVIFLENFFDELRRRAPLNGK